MSQVKPENEYWRKIINTKFDTTKAYITFLQNTLKLEIRSKKRLEEKLVLAKEVINELALVAEVHLDDTFEKINKLKECLFQTQEASKDLAVMNQNQRIYFDENVELKKKLEIAFDELQSIATGMRHGKERESALKALTKLSE